MGLHEESRTPFVWDQESGQTMTSSN